MPIKTSPFLTMYDRRKYDHLTLEEKVDTALEILDSIAYAFPDGPSKHREAHEAMIEAKKAETRFYDALRLELAKKGVWFLLAIFLGLMWAGFPVIKNLINTKLGV